MTFASAMFIPPVNPTAPSTTKTFLCERRFTNGIRHGSTECRNRAATTPSRRSR